MNRIRTVTLAVVLSAAAAAGCAPTATQRTAGQFADDATITAKVKTALIAEDDVNANAINVNTYRGVVQLSGFVDSPQMIREAGEIARQTAGVRSVQNDITVAPRR